MQLFNQKQQNVELAYRSETRGHASKPTVELVSRAVVELEDGQQFAKPARCDTRPMQRADVALPHTVKDA
jgi:hypothetical protein